MKTFRKVGEAWNQFMFSVIDPLPVACLRIGIGLLMLSSLLANSPNWHRNLAVETMGGPWDFSEMYNVFTWTQGNISVVLVGWLGVFLAITYTLGWRPKISAVLLHIVLTSIYRRNWRTTNAEDTMFRMYLFYSLFLPLSDSLSLDRWLKARRTSSPLAAPPTHWCWPVRMVQIHLLLIYLISTPTKWMSDEVWRTGDAMYYIMINPMWSRWPWPWMFYYGWVTKITTYSSMLLEGSCPFLIWIPKLRKYVTCEMIFFHCMLAFCLRNITWFSLTMIPGLFLFLKGDEIRDAFRIVANFLRIPVRVAYKDVLADGTHPQ